MQNRTDQFNLWAAIREGLRRNLAPGLILQAFGLSLVLAYYYWPAAQPLFSTIARLKGQYGYLFSAISTSLCGGLIPFLILRKTGQLPDTGRRALFAFYILYWIWKGMEVDLLYRLQGVWFGDGHDVATLTKKMLVDQFLYNPFWSAPTAALFFAWKEQGFALKVFREVGTRRMWLFRVPAVLIPTWLVWIPAVCIIYALPGALQIPLFNVVLCFWTLLLTFITHKEG